MSLGRHPPENYPSACLVAFVKNEPSPGLYELVDHVDKLTHAELVVCCKAVVEQGADPEADKATEWAKMTKKDLSEYLQECCTEYSSEGKRTRWPSFYERSKIETFPVADLAALVKQCNPKPWHDFCNETLQKPTPSEYPASHLKAFLVGDGPPEKEPPEAVEAADTDEDGFGVLSTEELADLCNAAVEDGYPPLEGDPSSYSRDDLLQYLRAHGNDDTEMAEEESGRAEDQAEENDAVGEDEMQRIWHECTNQEEPEDDGAAPVARRTPGSFLAMLREQR